jgi:lipopolysaccharide transport system ATP-binding protein
VKDVAIRVEGLGKQYSIGARQEEHNTLRDTIAEVALRPVRALRSLWERNGKAEAGCETIWALKDVSFEVERGEVIGIIGRNGAGKSTLLKILSRITEPTEGWVDLCGPVGALLEVGTGFHPELTGRENIYLNGAILGMKRAEIARKFDEIVGFAEVEKFIDTPVKHYSSGMYLRLAFAVAAHLEPEILIIDEVLAVGDAAFQKRCLGKIGDVSKGGRTVLFVSHNMTAINSLCTKAIWLDEGQQKIEGPAAHVVAQYLQCGSQLRREQSWPNHTAAPCDNQARLCRVRVIPADGSPNDTITIDTPVRMEFEYFNYRTGAWLNLSVVLYNLEGLCVFNTGSPPNAMPSGVIRSSFEIPGNFLNDGVYRVRLLVVRDEGTVLIDHDNVAMFEVIEAKRQSAWHGKWIGVVRPQFEWLTQLHGSVTPESRCDS